MRIETQDRLKRLEGAASQLLASNESADCKAEVGLQINLYRFVLEQIEASFEHTPEMDKLVTPIDEFCALAERTFAARRA